ncbi:Uncharacterised protein [uncultured archaeon]|nr:Uncharacterised protein [uncultured archaeon]
MFMTGVFERIIWQNKRSEVIRSRRGDRKVQELETAKEILSEVFSVKISDVDEMIRNRYSQDAYWAENRESFGQEKKELWTRESSQ